MPVAALARIEVISLDAGEGGDRHGFQFGAAREASREAAAVQVDQHPPPVAGRNARSGRVDVGVDPRDGRVLAVDGEQHLLPGQVALHEQGHAVLLGDEVGTLHVLQVLGQIGLAFRAQEVRGRHGHGRRMHGSVRVDADGGTRLLGMARGRSGAGQRQHGGRGHVRQPSQQLRWSAVQHHRRVLPEPSAPARRSKRVGRQACRPPPRGGTRICRRRARRTPGADPGTRC